MSSDRLLCQEVKNKSKDYYGIYIEFPDVEHNGPVSITSTIQFGDKFEEKIIYGFGLVYSSKRARDEFIENLNNPRISMKVINNNKIAIYGFKDKNAIFHPASSGTFILDNGTPEKIRPTVTPINNK